MRLYRGPLNVFDAAERRLDWLYSEFGDIFVCTSGGKDSTVLLELAARAAGRANRLPVKAVFIDQEFEYQGTVDYMRALRERPDEVDLAWVQSPNYRILIRGIHP